MTGEDGQSGMRWRGLRLRRRGQRVVQEPVRAMQFSINNAGDELRRHTKELGRWRKATVQRIPETGTQNNGWDGVRRR